jgi:hypothetical protein
MSLSSTPRVSDVEEAAMHLKLLAADFPLSIRRSGVRSTKKEERL